MADDISSLPWRVKVRGSTVGAFDSIHTAAEFTTRALPIGTDLTDVTIEFTLEKI